LTVRGICWLHPPAPPRNSGTASAAATGRNRYPPRYPTATSFDGGFNFCRLMYTSDRREPADPGGRPTTGMPTSFLDTPRRADQDDDQPAGRMAVPTTSRFAFPIPALFQCPILSATDIGTALFTDEEAVTLRAYLEKGGFPVGR
jgi:hypothetical protein